MAKDLDEYRFEVIKFVVDLATKWASLFFVAIVACVTLYVRADSNSVRFLFAGIGLLSSVISLFVVTGVIVVVEMLNKEFFESMSASLTGENVASFKKQTGTVMSLGRAMYGAALTTSIVVGAVFASFLFAEPDQLQDSLRAIPWLASEDPTAPASPAQPFAPAARPSSAP